MVAMGSTPEELRLRYLYRRAILRGEARVPLAGAKMLIGPDCAFHLYATVKGGAEEAEADSEAPDSRTSRPRPR